MFGFWAYYNIVMLTLLIYLVAYVGTFSSVKTTVCASVYYYSLQFVPRVGSGAVRIGPTPFPDRR